MPARLSERLRTAELFASGKHPLQRAIFHRKEPLSFDTLADEEQKPRQPLRPHPQIYSERQNKGDRETEKIFDHNEHTGGPLKIFPGFRRRLVTEAGTYLVLIDQETDSFLAGIIENGRRMVSLYKELGKELPEEKLLFGLICLCFNNWGQNRFPLNTLKTDKNNPTGVYLGELVCTTSYDDLKCDLLGLMIQTVGQEFFGDRLTLHIGKAARYHPSCKGADRHAWNLLRIKEDQDPLCVDMTNYPLTDFFQLVQDFRYNQLDFFYDEFLRRYDGFFPFSQESNPPDYNTYFEYFYDPTSITSRLIDSRQSCVYWSDGDKEKGIKSQYLGTALLPKGWD